MLNNDYFILFWGGIAWWMVCWMAELADHIVYYAQAFYVALPDHDKDLPKSGRGLALINVNSRSR